MAIFSHAVSAATKKGVLIESLMHPFDTTAGWRAQYAKTIEIPSSAQINAFAHLIDTKLRLPKAIKCGRGRPRKTRRISLAEKLVGKKRPMTCHFCFEKGHTKATCPSKPSKSSGAAVAV